MGTCQAFPVCPGDVACGLAHARWGCSFAGGVPPTSHLLSAQGCDLRWLFFGSGHYPCCSGEAGVRPHWLHPGDPHSVTGACLLAECLCRRLVELVV